MTDLPDPLVPAECSMAGDDWFPLYFDRLRKSKWWRRASDVARARNIMLWGEAYKARPAGSLPDDDDELAEAAGYGMDVDAFLEFKADIMAPWTLCSDGRWYHPTVCEQVLDSWERRGATRKAESARKAEYRRRVRSQGKVPAKSAAVPRDTPTCPTGHEEDGGGSHGTPPSVPPGLGLQTIQTVQEGTTVPVGSPPPIATVTSVPDGVNAKRDPWASDEHFAAAWKACTDKGRTRSSRAKAWPEWRRVRDRVGGEALARAMARYVAADEDAKRTGGPGFHLWLKDGRYEHWLGPSAVAAAPVCAFPGPPALRASVVDVAGEDFALKFIDPAGWRDADRTLVARNIMAADRIHRELRDWLTRTGVRLEVHGEHVHRDRAALSTGVQR
ncbi:hypothetical protein SGCZBJ_03760 [Caulobacter zeae]|uniref:DUF1376 domain-containing protein n=1 Tax=Caulobacter zeae TaxID=2055137 RepID=A0A2N5DQ17_9CAUL|nr:DUF1376 domain-containing protein [Caulobacter zeae]PLR28134.1 hypothetical protein SGCZBJ_03760 [Caulobacter zeae]